jgi:hypothetical protein
VLLGGLVFLGIGILYGWYKDNQINNQIAEEKRGYLTEPPAAELTSTVIPTPTTHTPAGGLFPEGQPTIEPTGGGEEHKKETIIKPPQ